MQPSAPLELPDQCTGPGPFPCMEAWCWAVSWPQILFPYYKKPFPCSKYAVNFLVLLMCVHHMAPGQPHPYFCLWQERNRVFTCSTRWVHAVHHHLPAIEWDLLAMGDHCTLQKLILLRLFSFLWGKCSSNQCPCMMAPPWYLQSCRICSGLRSVNSYFWCWHGYDSGHCPCSENPHEVLVAGSSFLT